MIERRPFASLGGEKLDARHGEGARGAAPAGDPKRQAVREHRQRRSRRPRGDDHELPEAQPVHPAETMPA